MDFTCICCRVAFKDGEIQRLHYKTDWHRYNLMRKVADLPPVVSGEFQRRVLAQKAVDKLQYEDTNQYCKCCRKAFSNSKTYENHLCSKKHKSMASKYEEHAEEVNNMEVDKNEVHVESDIEDDDEEIEEVDSDEWDEDMEVDVRNCLFCLHHSKNLVKNLKHMSEMHSFFIPDIEFCTDINGLIEYLAQKIEHGYICLWCNEKGKTYYTPAATRKHMLDKGHTKMIHDGVALAEYTDFYDYSTSYPDGDDETADSNQEVEIPEMDGNEFQLVLPSGSVIGHRSLMRYYKQSIDPSRIVAVKKNSNKLHKVLSSYRALGWSPEQQEVAAKRARDIHHMKRLISKYRMKLGTKANKLQTHFRQQVLF